ncbi:MAG TPA: hypothetical protein VG099_01970 [Gemmataceae bacterium]|nr:hypothetical protein [Gemmataceae bacterium]
MGTGAKLGILAIVVLLVAASGVGAWYWIAGFRTLRTDILTATVHKDKLAITVKERGILESAENNDVSCRVKARTPNATTATTIKWVIDDGSHVKKGDLLAELDDSGIIETLKTENITVDQKRAEWVAAQEAYKIQLSQNESDIQTKRTAFELAKIDLEKYQKGDFPQSLKDVDGRVKIAESDLEQQRDRAAWAQRMLKKGYYTVSQADAEQSTLQSKQLGLDKVLEERRVLTDPTYGLKKRTETDLINKLTIAKDELDRAQAQARAKEVTTRSDRDSKKSVFDQESAKQKDLEEEIRKCKIFAPQDGLVVYYVPEQTRGGFGAQQSVVAQGEPVREGQKLMRIPNLKRMMVNTKVHEALVSNVRGEVRDGDGKVIFGGQPARVRVDAYNERDLKAHVKSVATVAAQSDWMSADVKMYVTMVTLDEAVEGLKPGMSAEVNVLVDKTTNDVFIVPVQALMGSPAMGKKRVCWTKTPEGGYEQREVEVGASNEKEAEIRSGLKEGEQVVLNYKVLEDERVKANKPSLADRAETEEVKGTDWGKTPSPAAELQKVNGGGESASGPPAGPGKTAGKKGGKGKGKMTPEMQKQRQEFEANFKKATPAQRKEMLEQIPEDFREMARQRLKAQGLEIAD